MSRLLRAVVLVLMVLALPLQGLAAARMLMPGIPGSPDAMPCHEAPATPRHHAQPHAAHAEEALPAAAPQSQPAPSDEASGPALHKPAQPSKCSACASCCHGSGITGPVLQFPGLAGQAVVHADHDALFVPGQPPGGLERPPRPSLA